MCLELGIYVSDINLLENVERRWTKRINGFENLIYSQILKDLEFFSVKGRFADSGRYQMLENILQ